MTRKNKTIMLMLAGTLLCAPAFAQSEDDGEKAPKKDTGVQFSGSIQTDFLIPQDDASIGTEQTDNKVQNNTYIDLGLTSKYIEAGMRFEFTEYPLPGFEKDFGGVGIANMYLKGKYKNMELTAGSLYEQFGSGFILRTYEERSLGIDNSLLGLRAKINAVKGLRLTALAGVQRRYWDWSMDSRIFGADAEVDLNEYIKALQDKDVTWTIGGSWVMKNEELPSAETPIFVPGTPYMLNVPKNVHAFDVRTQISFSDFTILGEGAWKTDDPSFNNGYTFNTGSAVMLSASYSKKGLSALVQAKRSEDMAFRSQRSMTGMSAYLNHMPAFAYQHTYALAALYPYATQYANVSETGSVLTPGEWAFQAELAYTFKRKTALGGKYGTKVKLNFSHVRGLDATLDPAGNLPDGTPNNYTYGRRGYKTSFFGMGQLHYQDVNLQVEKKFSKAFKLNAMYMHQIYNQPIIENHGNKMYNNIIVLDGRYQFNDRFTLRMEYQHLFAGTTKEDAYIHSTTNGGDVTNTMVGMDKTMAESSQPGDWDYIMAELTILPHFMITVSDMIGKPFFADGYHDKEHYYMVQGTFLHGAHRLNVGYGRTRAGYNCSGGVCRWVPASKGVQVQYNYTF